MAIFFCLKVLYQMRHDLAPFRRGRSSAKLSTLSTKQHAGVPWPAGPASGGDFPDARAEKPPHTLHE